MKRFGAFSFLPIKEAGNSASPPPLPRLNQTPIPRTDGHIPADFRGKRTDRSGRRNELVTDSATQRVSTNR